MIRRTSISVLLLALFALPALAGGGPETTLVVVNGNSPVSREVANVYRALRDIPDTHFAYLDSVPHLGVITLDFFLEKIWAPIESLHGFVFRQTVGWHPIRIRVDEAGAPNLTVLHSGAALCAPPRLRHAGYEALDAPPAPAGAAAKQPIAVPGEGLELTGSKTVRNISAIVLTPPAKAEAFPQDWIVEVSSGRNKWKLVKNVTVLVGPGAEAVPLWIELSFRPLRARMLRVRPKDGKATSLGKVEVLGKPVK